MSDTTFISLKNYYPRDIPIDDDEGDVRLLPIRVRRFTIEQMQVFQLDFYRFENPDFERRIYRKPDGEEQEKEPITIGNISAQVHRINDAEIRRRRLSEMTEAERDDFEKARLAHEKFTVEFLKNNVTEHAWVAPGVRLVIEDEVTGEPRVVQTGADLVAVFGGNLQILTLVAKAIFEENNLSAAEKKRLRSRSNSTPGSSTPTAVGPTPAATADAAETSDSVAPEPAMAGAAPIPSGSPTT